MDEGAQLIAFQDTELDNFVKQEEEAFSALQWSQETLSLSKFVKKFTLPQIVRIEDGYYSQEEDSSLSSGQILKIHCLKTSKKVMGLDQHGENVHIPLNANEKVLIRPDNWSKSYETVNDLFQAKPSPKYVEVTRGYYDPTGNSEEQDHTVEPGERLEVLGEVDPRHFPRPQKQRLMKFKNCKGIELSLPFDCAPQFIALQDTRQQLIAEVVHNKKLPVYISFAALSGSAVYTNRSSTDKNLSRFGVVKLIEVYEEELIVASCGHHSVRVIFTIPKSIDVTVKVAAGTLLNDPMYVGLCQGYNNYNKIETLAIQRHEKDIYRTSGEVRGYEYYLKSIEGGEFEGMEDNSDYYGIEDDGSEDEYVYSEEFTRSPGANSIKSRVTLPYEVTSINVDDFKKGGKYSKHLSLDNTKMDQETASIDYGIKTKGNSGSSKESVTLIGVRKFSTEDSNSEAKNTIGDSNSMKDIELQDSDQYLVAVNVNKVIDTATRKQDSKSERRSEMQSSRPTTADFIIPSDLESLSTDDVCKCLKKLNLGQFEKVFRENQINGELLVSLELEDCKDLHMTNFQAKKILKFVGGWRPDI